MRKLTIVPLASAAALALAFSACKKEEKKSEPAPKVTTPTETPTKTDQVSSVPITSSSPGAVALLREGRDLQEGFRFAAATKKYKKAVDLDPDFALGHAQLAALSKGEQALAHRKKAVELAAKLPETERLLIETMVAESKEARDKALTALAEKVPNDWQVQVLVARAAQYQGKIDAARKAFEKAAELNPKAANPHNNLAYIYAEEGDFDKAVASVTKYAQLSPGEPNPLDSKGEILLMAGKFAEAEAAFSEALKLADDFAIAHEGIAATKFYRDDWKGGIAELEKAANKATRAIDRHEMQNKLAWALVAAGKDRKAEAAFSASRASAKEAGIAMGASAEQVRSAEILMHKGDHEGAFASAEKAIEMMVAEEVPEKKQHWARAIHVVSAARAGKLDVAEKALTKLSTDAKGSHYVAFAQTQVSIAKGDAEAAIKSAKELKHDKWFSGRAMLLTAEALEKAGEADKAKEIRKELSTRYRRDIHSVILAQDAKKAGEG